MNLKERRKMLGLSQDDIAKKIGVHNTTYGNWELGKTEPNLTDLIKLAEIFHITTDELLGRDLDLINLKFLDEDQSLIIKAVLRMNKEQLSYTKRFVESMITDM